MKSYRKPMELSDLKAIEKALFQQYYDKIDEDIILLADNDDASDIEQITVQFINGILIILQHSQT